MVVVPSMFSQLSAAVQEAGSTSMLSGVEAKSREFLVVKICPEETSEKSTMDFLQEALTWYRTLWYSTFKIWKKLIMDFLETLKRVA